MTDQASATQLLPVITRSTGIVEFIECSSLEHYSEQLDFRWLDALQGEQRNRPQIERVDGPASKLSLNAACVARPRISLSSTSASTRPLQPSFRDNAHDQITTLLKIRPHCRCLTYGTGATVTGASAKAMIVPDGSRIDGGAVGRKAQCAG